jgi:uncharacterized protein (TIGR03083 family)
MTEVLAKEPLRVAIRSARAALDDRIAALTPDELTRPGVFDGHSVKDIVAHITAWERRLVNAIDAWKRGETPAWPEPGYTLDDTDRLNDRDFDANRDRPLDEVLAESRASYAAVMALVDSLMDTDLVEPTASFRPFPLSLIIRANTDEHYVEHIEQIDAWRKR